MNNVFKLANTLIFINFYPYYSDIINACHKSNLRIIHVFVFRSNHVDTEKLSNFSNACRRSKIKLIIHCFNKQDINVLKKRMKGIKKDKYFHFSLMKDKITFISSKKIEIEFRKVTITKHKKTGEEAVVIEYLYKGEKDERN